MKLKAKSYYHLFSQEGQFSLIYSFKKYILSTNHVSNNMLGNWKAEVGKKMESLPFGVYTVEG